MSSERLRILNVGSGPETTPIPDRYDGWEHVRMDVDPRLNPDVLIDARNLLLWVDILGPFSAVYCSHNLEHYYIHDALKVLQGMYAVLTPGGHVMLRMPDVQAVATALANGADLHDKVPGCTFDWHQCLYGDTLEIMRLGEPWAHKTGFTEESLKTLLLSVGFVNPIFERHGGFELAAMAWKPTVAHGHDDGDTPDTGETYTPSC